MLEIQAVVHSLRTSKQYRREALACAMNGLTAIRGGLYDIVPSEWLMRDFDYFASHPAAVRIVRR